MGGFDADILVLLLADVEATRGKEGGSDEEDEVRERPCSTGVRAPGAEVGGGERGVVAVNEEEEDRDRGSGRGGNLVPNTGLG